VKAIMYHYVREYDESHPNFRFLDVANFRRQLDFFESEYGFVNKNCWVDCVNGESSESSKGKIILTFDDAMSCHYDYVFPELEKRGLWGIFYVPTMPYTEHKMLDVHRIHLLCGAFEGRDLKTELMGLISDEMIPDGRRAEFRNKTYTTQTNYDGVSEFKRVLNYFVDYKYRESLINQIASNFGYKFNCDSFYISLENLRNIAEAGHLIGSHTVSHPVMSKLSRVEQKRQIDDSFAFINQIGSVEDKTYCHPYGGFHSFNEDTVDLLSMGDVKYSFNVESRDITKADMKNTRHFLPRYDCNQFVYGKAS